MLFYKLSATQINKKQFYCNFFKVLSHSDRTTLSLPLIVGQLVGVVFLSLGLSPADAEFGTIVPWGSADSRSHALLRPRMSILIWAEDGGSCTSLEGGVPLHAMGR